MVDIFAAGHGSLAVRSPNAASVRLSRGRAGAKRGFDLLAAATLLIVLSWLFLAIAIAVALDSPGPVLFRQRRTGRHGRAFVIYKFRSMTVGDDDQVPQATRGDPRVTRVGAFIRSTSLDELPQLMNVIRGEMSLVGPRPHAVIHDARYGPLIAGYRDRFSVRPGLTGLAQVRGLRGETRDLGCMARRIEADADYVARWSLIGDLAIIARTVPAMLSRKNAY
ncbi:MAG: sugar transferase [Pseudomonadota bacterium]